jgi:hypothetical protein
MSERSRRQFLTTTATGVSASLLAGLAGCTGNDIQDADDDGRIDSEDYAPDDPSVQEKSDVASYPGKETTTKTTTTTPTSTITTTPTTRTTTTTDTDTDTVYTDTITVDTDPFNRRTDYFTEYSLTRATVIIEPDTLQHTYDGKAQLYVAIFSHPRREASYGLLKSDPFTIQDTPFSVTATTQPEDINLPNQGVYQMALLLPADISPEEATDEEVEKLCETNRFTVTDTSINPNPHPASLESVETDAFTRTAGEGKYLLDFYGTTNGHEWNANYVIHKSIYIEKATAQRGRSRSEYVAVAQTSGIADTMGIILEKEARDNGFTTKREQAAFLIDFVQNLPYVTDNVSKGFDDYTKFMTETLTEASGDCEDTSILLAALLQSQPFNYDAVLLELPGHMAVGVYGEDLPGYYWEHNDRQYYYLETTGEGWGVGDLPDEYKNESAQVYNV